MYHILCIHVLVNDIWIVSFLAIMHDAAMNIYGQSILIQRVCICKFAYWLEFICNPKMNMLGTFTVIHRHVQSDKKFESPCAHIPS